MPIFGPDKLIISNKLYLHENHFVCFLRFDRSILIYSELIRYFKVEINAAPTSIRLSNCKFQIHTYKIRKFYTQQNSEKFNIFQKIWIFVFIV